MRSHSQLGGEVVLVLSYRSAESLVETQSEALRDPIESAGLFEGDIANVKIADLRRLRSEIWPGFALNGSDSRAS